MLENNCPQWKKQKKGRKILKDNIFKNIAKNSFNNSLEEVLSKKNFSEDIKNTLLSIFYKLDNGYDDYKTVKRNTYENNSSYRWWWFCWKKSY